MQDVKSVAVPSVITMSGSSGVNRANAKGGAGTETNWESFSTQELGQRLGFSVPLTDAFLNTGLSLGEVNTRTIEFGPNQLQREGRTPLWSLFLAQFTHFLVLMLIVSSIVSMALGHFVEGLAILVTVVLNAIVATYTENSSANALEALADLSQPQANVVRST